MRFLFLICGLLLSLPLSAQTLSLQDVLRSVEQNYPLIEAERQKLRKAEGEITSRQGAFDTKIKGKLSPSLLSKKETYQHYNTFVEQPTTLYGAQFYAGWSLGVGAFPDYYGEYITSSRGDLLLGATLPLLRGGAIDEPRAALQQAELSRDIASAELQNKLLWYQRAATHKYWDWIAAGSLLEVERKLLLLAEERDAAIHSRVEQGLLPEIEALDNERQVISRRAKVMEAELKLQQAALELSLYWRDSNGQPLVPNAKQLAGWPSISTPSAEKLSASIETALIQRPELSVIEAQRSQSEVSLSLAENQRLPALDLNLETIQPLVGGPELAAGLAFELPLQQRKAKGSITKASAEKTQRDVEQIYLQEAIRVEVQSAFLSLETAAKLVKLQQENLVATQKLSEAERKRFDLGTSNLFLVNLREQSAAEAAASLIEAQRRYFVAEANLSAAIGNVQ